MSDIYMKKLEETPFVYHYTNIEALFAILEGYRVKKETGLIPFRASCIYNTNDPREMKLGFEVVKKILPEYEKSLPNSLNLSEVFQNADYENECFRQFNQRPTDEMIGAGCVPYFISLTENRDFLPMWSMYGNSCKGVCLKFNLGKLVDTNTPMGFVSYGEDENGYVKEWHLHQLYGFFTRLHRKGMAIDGKIRDLSQLCFLISPFVKDKSWAYEKEFRIEDILYYKTSIGLDFSRRLLFGGIKIKRNSIIPIYANALEEIIIGPKVDYNVFEHILRNELKECLLNRVKITPSIVDIK